MADYSMYHALGQGEQLDPNNPNQTSQPAPPQFVPPVAQQQYQQAAPYGAPAPQQPYYGAPAPAPAPMGQPPLQPQLQPQQPMGYGAPQPGSPQDQALAAQMGGMALGDGVHSVRKKKKDRHAYHNVAAPAAATAFGTVPPVPAEPAGPYGPATAAPGGPQLLSPAQGSAAQFSPSLAPGQGPQSQFPQPTSPGFAPPTEGPGATVPVAGPGFGSSAGPPSVSADDLPSVPVMRDATQQYFLKNMYPTFERHVPPPASIFFRAFDQGNASPKFARLTMNSLPATADGLNTTSLPLGLILQPLAPQTGGELPVPVLDFGASGPPRCRRCRAYINPFMMFQSGGNKFVCNLCSYPNETSPEYFCATTPAGVRVDRDQRPELTRGTVEFVVPKEYWTREPVGMRWLFVIDVTQESYNRGFLEAFCEGILSALYGGEEAEEDEDGQPKRQIPKGAKVGFATFDKDIHFYNVSVGSTSKGVSAYANICSVNLGTSSNDDNAGHRRSLRAPERRSLR